VELCNTINVEYKNNELLKVHSDIPDISVTTQTFIWPNSYTVEYVWVTCNKMTIVSKKLVNWRVEAFMTVKHQVVTDISEGPGGRYL
jgi:hypothetical protein